VAEHEPRGARADDGDLVVSAGGSQENAGSRWSRDGASIGSGELAGGRRPAATTRT
jgi:hypothetical protein